MELSIKSWQPGAKADEALCERCNMSSRRKNKNKFVSQSLPGSSRQEQRAIQSLSVILLKDQPGFSHGNRKAAVWGYYGSLATDVNGSREILDGEKLYCALCLDAEQK
ncbi:hypothetical protein CAPTEDRAFT_200005, partial [Capitella teleta]